MTIDEMIFKLEEESAYHASEAKLADGSEKAELLAYRSGIELALSYARSVRQIDL